MKKLLSFLSLTLLLTACNSEKWNQADPDMPQELIESHQEILDEQLVLLEEDPKNSDALFEVAYRYQQLGDWKQAVKYYEQVLEISGEDWATLNNLAYMYETMEDYETAAEYIKRLYSKDPTNVEVIKDTVRILLEAGYPENAQEALDNFASQVIDEANPSADFQALVDELQADINEWKEENE